MHQFVGSLDAESGRRLRICFLFDPAKEMTTLLEVSSFTFLRAWLHLDAYLVANNR